MSNYNEYNVAGSKWTRSPGGTFNNPYQGTPSINFAEENVITLTDGTIVKQIVGNPVQTYLTTSITDPAQQFPLLNANTGEVIGTASYIEVFNILHSLYIYLANDRDAQVIVRQQAQIAADVAAAKAASDAQAQAQVDAAAQAARIATEIAANKALADTQAANIAAFIAKTNAPTITPILV